MNTENRELLEKVIKMKLEESLEEGHEDSFEEAMAAIDRQIELDKVDNDKKNEKVNKLIKGVEIGTAVLIVPIIEVACKQKYARMICEFEKNDIFTTTPGRALNGLFKFKK